MKKQHQKPDKTDYKTLYLRCLADFENFRKRTENEKASWTDEAKIDFLFNILPVLDNLVLIAEHQPKELKENAWAKGVELVAKQIETTLEEQGIEKINPKPADDFDPNFHEAIEAQENKKIKPGKIISVQKPGYKIDSKLIRAAKVITSR